MARRPLKRRLTPVLASVVVGACALSAIVIPLSTASTVGAAAGPTLARECVTLQLRATPIVNAQNAPYETIKSTVASCSSHPEIVTLSQTLSGPFAQVGQHSRVWTITLAPGQSVVKARYIAYSCCGTYTVTDRVLSSAGQVLAHRSADFTFA